MSRKQARREEAILSPLQTASRNHRHPGSGAIMVYWPESERKDSRLPNNSRGRRTGQVRGQ
jgi:hypothetical protein